MDHCTALSRYLLHIARLKFPMGALFRPGLARLCGPRGRRRRGATVAAGCLGGEGLVGAREGALGCQAHVTRGCHLAEACVSKEGYIWRWASYERMGEPRKGLSGCKTYSTIPLLSLSLSPPLFCYCTLSPPRASQGYYIWDSLYVCMYCHRCAEV